MTIPFEKLVGVSDYNFFGTNRSNYPFFFWDGRVLCADIRKKKSLATTEISTVQVGPNCSDIGLFVYRPAVYQK